MKYLTSLIITLLLGAGSAMAQKICSVDYQYQADFKVYVTD